MSKAHPSKTHASMPPWMHDSIELQAKKMNVYHLKKALDQAQASGQTEVDAKPIQDDKKGLQDLATYRQHLVQKIIQSRIPKTPPSQQHYPPSQKQLTPKHQHAVAHHTWRVRSKDPNKLIKKQWNTIIHDLPYQDDYTSDPSTLCKKLVQTYSKIYTHNLPATPEHPNTSFADFVNVVTKELGALQWDAQKKAKLQNGEATISIITPMFKRTVVTTKQNIYDNYTEQIASKTRAHWTRLEFKFKNGDVHRIDIMAHAGQKLAQIFPFKATAVAAGSSDDNGPTWNVEKFQPVYVKSRSPHKVKNNARVPQMSEWDLMLLGIDHAIMPHIPKGKTTDVKTEYVLFNAEDAVSHNGNWAVWFAEVDGVRFGIQVRYPLYLMPRHRPPPNHGNTHTQHHHTAHVASVFRSTSATPLANSAITHTFNQAVPRAHPTPAASNTQTKGRVVINQSPLYDDDQAKLRARLPPNPRRIRRMQAEAAQQDLRGQKAAATKDTDIQVLFSSVEELKRTMNNAHMLQFALPTR